MGLLGWMPVTWWYKALPPATLIHEVTVLNCLLAIPELDGCLLYNRSADSGTDCGRLLGSMPATRWYKVPLCRIKTHESTNSSESCLSTGDVAELNGGSLHNGWADSESDCRGLLGTMPATLGYMIYPEGPIFHWATRSRVEDEGVKRPLMT